MALAYFKSVGFTEARLGYVMGNEQAEHFWLKNGFKPTGVTSKREGYTVAVMRREL